MEIGENIRKIRVTKGFSQEYMAKTIGISQRNYSKIERNEINITCDKIISISKTLDIQPYSLFNNSCKHSNALNKKESLFEKIEILLNDFENRISLLEKKINS
jgi:transcriptional regulator with XRE-family HTH domain